MNISANSIILEEITQGSTWCRFVKKSKAQNLVIPIVSVHKCLCTAGILRIKNFAGEEVVATVYIYKLS
jgi:hypothetical protein